MRREVDIKIRMDSDGNLGVLVAKDGFKDDNVADILLLVGILEKAKQEQLDRIKLMTRIRKGNGETATV